MFEPSGTEPVTYNSSYLSTAPSSRSRASPLPSPPPSLLPPSTGPGPNESGVNQQTGQRWHYQDNPAEPFLPTLATTSRANYGRIYPENENNLPLVAGVPFDAGPYTRWPTMPTQHSDLGQVRKHDWASSHSPSSLLLSLPAELIDAILLYLGPQDLAAITATCTILRRRAVADIFWQRFVQEHVPFQLTTPGPCASFHQLFVAHDRAWFLPKYKIWFSDRNLTGRLLIVRFDPRRGCIEGYQLLAINKRTVFEQWNGAEDVIIHHFEPRVRLHLDKPILRFAIGEDHSDGGFSARTGANRYADDMPMIIDDRHGGMYSNFMLAKSLDPDEVEESFALGYPYRHIWPSPCVPAREHAAGFPANISPVINIDPEDRPWRRGQVSDQSFRMRQWMEMAGSPGPFIIPTFLNNMGGGAGPSIHIGEEVMTYSTLDPSLYTPTPTKPWRGIWVGDYSGHGCEFLLLHQPDDEPATDEQLGLIRSASESKAEWERRRMEARIYRGRLEAIKLTGDPNIPRGEYTFVVDDLGPNGYVGISSDSPFTGSRIVRSKGHIAMTGFQDDKFIESELFLISQNRLAQHWLEFGHISFFERVDIDAFVDPRLPNP
ncbi:hypothetical protein S7711_07512 [Stachybotrys chartarum IBT 7711]|uniref:F-box domain-containing protein n=1 Tax=Stachybotrys chartarum (strain CBS 109288 / IBT 7711) TaxID=1280523 RepID=A0A084AK50_STACB|nr:hypothetical protein S7711_07512 [Stachybotrys chartarum IBT 7711]